MVIYIDGIPKSDDELAERARDNQRRLGEDPGTG